MNRLIPLLLLITLPCALLRADTTVVVVNFQTVFEEYGELQRLDREFRQSVEEFQNQQKSEVEQLQAKQQEFNALRQQAAQPEVSDEQRKELAEKASVMLEDLNQEEQRLRQERQQFQQELEAKGVRLRRRIVEEVKERIASFALNQGWDLVLDGSANGQNGLPVIQYANPNLDKTRWVITELNKRDAAGEE